MIAAIGAASKGFRILIVAERQSAMSLIVAREGGRPGPFRRSTAIALDVELEDLRQRVRVWREAVAQIGERREGPCVEAGLDQGGEIGFDAPLVGDGQRADDELAGGPFWQGLHRRVVEPAVGVAREELVAVDQPRQRPPVWP